MTDPDILKRLSEYVEYESNMTRNAFAVKSGIDPTNFSKMLAGKQSITTNTLKKISQAHGVNLEWLLTGEGDMMSKPGATVTYMQANSGGNNQQGNNNIQINLCLDDAAHIRELEKEIENLRAQLAHKDDIIAEMRSSAAKQDERISELKDWIADLRKTK